MAEMIYLKILMIAIGYGIRLWAVAHNPGFSFLIVAPEAVYKGGLYKYIRHPAYLGALIMCGGAFALCSGWVGAFPPWVVLAVFLHHVAIHEELLITMRFPEYQKYIEQTGMFLPRWRYR